MTAPVLQALRAGRDGDYWVVLRVTTRRCWFFFSCEDEGVYKRRDGERLWEDELGWYVVPTNPIAAELDAAVAAHEPVKAATP